MNKKTILRLIISLSVVMMLNACSSEDDNSTSPAVITDPFSVSWSSGCRSYSTFYILHYVTFNSVNNTFSGNSVSFTDPTCNDRFRAGNNVLGGTFSLGNDVTVSGVTATELNIVYDPLKVDSVLYFDPSPFDLAYFDSSAGVVYLGDKTGASGQTADTRPTVIDFNNAWTLQ